MIQFFMHFGAAPMRRKFGKKWSFILNIKGHNHSTLADLCFWALAILLVFQKENFAYFSWAVWTQEMHSFMIDL